MKREKPFKKYVLQMAAIAGLILAMPVLAEQTSEMDQREKEAFDIGTQAYIYAYPMVLMDTTRQVMTNVSSPQSNGRAPINQFGNITKFPTPEMKDVVMPNVDTLYSVAWLDLSNGPMVLHVPDTGGRYYVMQMLSAWTNVFAALGSRTSGTCEANFAIVGPNWSGDIPEGMRKLQSPTNLVWIIGRTKTDGPSDYKAVNAIQKQYALTPLESWGKSYTLPKGTVNSKIDMKTTPSEQVAAMSAKTFFSRFAELLKGNPPASEDSKMVDNLAKIGIVPGESFDFSKLDAATRRGLEHAVRSAIEKIHPSEARDSGTATGNWQMSLKYGEYGTDYTTRAMVAKEGLGANLAKDAIYPFTNVDADGKTLNGSKQYILHFAKDQIPPVNAFWSVTMYDDHNFLVSNPIDRYALSSWMSFAYNEDGSLDLYIQRDSPGKAWESNWLPAPEGNFVLTMRLYWPKQEILDGCWTPPPVKPVKTQEPGC
jgi:DNA sulfur modification protein DndE